MRRDLLSVRNRNAFGNVVLGFCLVWLSAALHLGPNHSLVFGAASCLLLVSVTALFACLSPRREMADEMSVAHDGQAAGHALRITLICVGIACTLSMATGVQLDFTATSIGFMGFGLLTYGVAFGWLER